MRKQVPMIQCCICGVVYTKNGKPNQFFNSEDMTIYGCLKCKEGPWQASIKKLENYKISKGDLGYKTVVPGSMENPSYKGSSDIDKITQWNIKHHRQIV